MAYMCTTGRRVKSTLAWASVSLQFLLSQLAPSRYKPKIYTPSCNIQPNKQLHIAKHILVILNSNTFKSPFSSCICTYHNTEENTVNERAVVTIYLYNATKRRGTLTELFQIVHWLYTKGTPKICKWQKVCHELVIWKTFFFSQLIKYTAEKMRAVLKWYTTIT